MTEPETSFILYDYHIIHLLEELDVPLPQTTSVSLQPFEGLQNTELIQALVDRKHRKAMGILSRLKAPLSPKDAAAASLCALAGPEKLMYAVLDHSPPIPEFQFLGAGKTASLLNVACRFDKYKMLKLLIQRGADPNKDPRDPSAPSPLEVAFCRKTKHAYLCLEQLLKCPGLTVELTDTMLSHWAQLDADHNDTYPTALWSCQILKEKLTGEPIDFCDPLPFPPQLRLETALEQQNLPLATHICRKRALTDKEKASAVRYLMSDHQVVFLDDWTMDIHREKHRKIADFLVSVLEQCPELVRLPEMRFSVTSMALAASKPEPALQHWAAQLEDGPVFLKELSASGGTYSGGFPTPKVGAKLTLSKHLFPRWDDRLGSRLVPTMDVSADLYLPFMDDDEIQLVLDRITFVGKRPADSVSAVGKQFLLHAPEEMLPKLLQPGALLAKESPSAVLSLCQALPAHRRNCILPHVHKSVEYEL